jgi:hypothetical protein
MDFIKTTKEESDEITKCGKKLLHEVYKKTFAYEFEKVIVNEDGTTTYLHSDSFLDGHPERRNSPEMTEEELKEQREFIVEFYRKFLKLKI